jgi:hypothetical protein
VLIHIHLLWCCLLSSCKFQLCRLDLRSDTLDIISQNISILRSLYCPCEFTLSWSVSWGSKLHGSPCTRAVRGAVGPLLSGSSAFVACAISYNRLGLSRRYTLFIRIASRKEPAGLDNASLVLVDFGQYLSFKRDIYEFTYSIWGQKMSQFWRKCCIMKMLYNLVQQPWTK